MPRSAAATATATAIAVPSTEAPRRMSPEARRELILDVAQRLFFERGWTAVTLTEVLAASGLSKGGFYHHFTAKDDLLDGVVTRMTRASMTEALAAQRAAPGDAPARFNAFLAALNRRKVECGPQMRFLSEMLLAPGNDLLFHRVGAAFTRAALPALTEIIGEGVREGHFRATDAALTAETILAQSLGQGRREMLRQALARARAGAPDEAARLVWQRSAREAQLIDRLLGLPPGSIELTTFDECRTAMHAVIRG